MPYGNLEPGSSATYSFSVTNIATERGIDLEFRSNFGDTPSVIDEMIQELIDHLNQLPGWYVGSGRKSVQYEGSFTPTPSS